MTLRMVRGSLRPSLVCPARSGVLAPAVIGNLPRGPQFPMSTRGLSIDVRSIPDKGTDREWMCDAQSLDLDADVVRMRAAASVAVHISRHGREVRVAGAVRCRLEQTCGRCSEVFERDEGLALDVLFLPAEAGADDAWRLDPHEAPDVNVNWYDGPQIDVGPDVRDVIMLSVPMTPLCRADCKGLCPRCGANLNAGPCACPAEPSASPFAVLEGLKSKLAAKPAPERKDT